MGEIPLIGKHEIEKARYRIRFEKALICSLLCTILLFLLFRRFPVQSITQKVMILSIFTTNMIPVTSQGGGSMRRPALPQVPIPSEDETLPEYETIELTDLDLREGIPFADGTGAGDGMFGGSGTGYGVREDLDPVRF